MNRLHSKEDKPTHSVVTFIHAMPMKRKWTNPIDCRFTICRRCWRFQFGCGIRTWSEQRTKIDFGRVSVRQVSNYRGCIELAMLSVPQRWHVLQSARHHQKCRWEIDGESRSESQTQSSPTETEMKCLGIRQPTLQNKIKGVYIQQS